jgi:hypothetical protein
MPTNHSSNKVTVVSFFGGGNGLGLCDPQVGMLTNAGKILSLNSGNYTVVLGVGSGYLVKQLANTYYLNVSSGVAATFTWPTGTDCVKFGHDHGMLASGEPKAVNATMNYTTGVSGVPFNRTESLN